MKKMDRRKFIGTASCAAVGTTTLFSTLGQLFMTNALAGPRSLITNDYKALVCILLAGGNDSHNMLLPRGNTEYNEYAATRTNLAIPQGNILPLDYTAPNGKIFGVHPNMPDVQTMFDNSELAFMANIGTLIEPIANRTEYYSGLKNRPLGLYSHSDQTEQWQTSVPQERDVAGWGGRIADIMQSLNDDNGISMNISLSGRNVFQSGETVLEYAISNDGTGAEGIDRINYGNNRGFMNLIRDQAIDSMMSKVYNNAFKSTFGTQTKNALDAQQLFSTAILNVPPLSTSFSDHYLSENLEMVAKVIAARETLGVNRQIFFMSIGGFDNHGDLLANQTFTMNVVNNALAEFNAAMHEIGMHDKVTLFTISDFARTLTTNGSGSDHAWGGQQMVMGGAVNGKEIYGEYPDLYIDNNPLNISSRGAIIPTTSTDAFFAELALWFGLNDSDLPLILPNIGNFYSPGDPDWPIGFLSQT